MIEKLRSTLAAKGGAHLGDITYWTLSDARISRPTLETVWASAGLDPAHLPEPPTAERAIKLAARMAGTGQADRLVRLGLESESQVIFTVIREQRLGDGSLTYAQEARVVLDRNTELASTDSPGHDLAEGILARFAELKDTHPSDDVRRAVMNVLGSCASITLRDHGGVYWIPAPHAATLRKLQAAIEKIGTSRVYLLPVHASADATKTLGEAAVAALTEELNALKTEVEGFVAAPPERQSTLVRRLDQYDELRGRAELYRSVLSVTVADLESTLTSLTASVEQLLNAKAAA
ncbi:MAG: hypothetical protein HY901_07975 [Deltaproteobacteria bacterium]|nr:hypothetical protein [Deltaproteobacteria bacterium]